MEDELIFKLEEGRQLKFFIQKDLDEKLIQELNDQITANGGRVQTKVPMQGFVLTEPTSREGMRLVGCWSTADRPLRHFVPYTFVKACLEARTVLPQVFCRVAEAVRFHLHPSITNERMLETLRARIWHSGGDPTATEEQANVIIADERLPVFRTLLERYEHSRDKFVESIHWVKQCITTGTYENTPVVKKNLGGRPAGIKRKEFTERDDNNLASYIARRLPDPTMRGRTGNKIYQDLCSRLDLYPWAEHHPWQSWRERYKNNVPRFSRLIAAYVEKFPPPENGKGLHGFVRAPSTSQTRAQSPDDPEQPVVEQTPADRDAEWGGSQWNVVVGRKSPPAWSSAKRKASEIQDGHEGQSTKRRIHTERADGHGVNHQTTSEPRVSDSQLGVVASQGSSHGPSFPKLADMLESENSESRNIALAHDMASVSSITRSPSPRSSVAHNSGEVEPESDDEVLGAETQAFITAHTDMLARAPAPSSASRVILNPGEMLQSDPAIEDRLPSEDEVSLDITDVHDDPAVRQTLASVPARKPDLHESQHELVRIACRYRFLLDEVEEVYEELGHDEAATAEHFKEVREFMIAKKEQRTGAT